MHEASPMYIQCKHSYTLQVNVHLKIDDLALMQYIGHYTYVSSSIVHIQVNGQNVPPCTNIPSSIFDRLESYVTTWTNGKMQ